MARSDLHPTLEGFAVLLAEILVERYRARAKTLAETPPNSADTLTATPPSVKTP